MDPRRRALPAPARAGRRGRRRLPRPGRLARRGAARARSPRCGGWCRGRRSSVQLDEPSLPAVLTGALPTASGFGRLRAVEEQVVVDGISDRAGGGRGRRRAAPPSCTAVPKRPPVGVLARTGADAVSVDVALLGVGRGGRRSRTPSRAAWPCGRGRCRRPAPCPRPVRSPTPSGPRGGPWGCDAGRLASVVLTPACGLAGSSPADARARGCARVRDAAGALAERAADAA